MASFRESAERELDGKVKEAVFALLDDTASSNPFVTAWRDADGQIRNAIAIERARRRGLTASETPKLPVQGCSVMTAQAVSAAFQDPNPLKREIAFAHLRWTILDDLQGVQPISENVLYAYAIKLRINEELLAVDAEKGAELFTRK